MASVYRVNLNEKKCATCRYWEGERQIFFRNRKPAAVDAMVPSAPCPARKNKTSPGMSCSVWSPWEKL